LVPPHSEVDLPFYLSGTPDSNWYVRISVNVKMGISPPNTANQWSVKKQYSGLSDCPYINHGNGGDPNRQLEDGLYFNDPANGDIATCEGLCLPDIVKPGDAAAFVNAVCTPVAASTPVGVVFGMGRDNKLYAKSSGIAGPWSAIPGYASTHQIVSIAIRPSGSMVGLEAGGKFYELAEPYRGDWTLSTAIPVKPGINSIIILSDNTLMGIATTGIYKIAPGNRMWTQVAASGQETSWPFVEFGIMPNTKYLFRSRDGMFAEYKVDDGQLLGVASPDVPYYPRSLTQGMWGEKADSFTFLNNRTLVFATRVGGERMVTWYVNNCGTGARSTVSNDGGAPSINNPNVPQWRSLTIAPTQ
jgi:hypothetical protein